jgi:peptide deformylase
MRATNLVGMAAPQVGENLRIFVTEVRKTKFRKLENLDALRVFVNPKIVRNSAKFVSDHEGCGSVAESGLFARVSRPEHLRVRALNEKGESFILETGGLLARIIQHEMDHLDGKVFLDRDYDPKSLKSTLEYLKYREGLRRGGKK